MTKTEIEMVSRYSAAELAGALVLGKWARKTRDPFLRAALTHHTAEESRHAFMWSDFLVKHGHEVVETHDQDEFFALLASAKDEIELLTAVHVYELRLPFHFGIHARMKSADPELKELIEKIAQDEKHHLSWINKYLSSLQQKGDKRVAEYISIAGELEKKVYKQYTHNMKTSGDTYFEELASDIESNLPSYTYEWKKFVV